jgi:two-component system cell cycle response regulator
MMCAIDPGPASPDRLLLVEDNRAQAMMIERMLELGDIELDVVHVGSLADAERFLRDSRAACVLLDLTLPDAAHLDGLMEVRHLAPETPVVVVTADSDVSRGVKAVQAGAQDYLIKGEMDSAHLCRSVRYAIERARSDLLLSHRALHDALTGLPNRVLFFDRAEYVLSQSERDESTVAMFFLDLNGFKGVNDRLGHSAGDALLRAVASRLLGWVRPGDVVSRLGGDEFTALVRDVKGTDVAVRIAERLAYAVGEPVTLDGEDVSLTPSIGIALAEEREQADALIARADHAMYSAKRSGAIYEIAVGAASPASQPQPSGRR